MAKLAKNMNDEELEQHLQDLSAKRAELKTEAQEYHAELDRRTAERTAAAALARMSDAERAALHQQLQAQGIESAEVMGTPGNAAS